jgi:tRNA(Arg) A34 adenosine deaminase TadA
MCLAAAYWARLRQITFAATRADAAWAGFMDERIYEELARAPGERKLPAAQLLRDEARAVLAEWRAKIDKTNY